MNLTLYDRHTSLVSVDIESDGPNAFKNNLLSVGMVRFDESGVLDTFYANVASRPERCMDSTTMVKFWGLHPDRFEDTQHFRHKDADHYPAPRDRVAMAIRQWLYKDSDPGKSWPLFIARPASFDKAWIDDLLEEHNPFQYTSLDIGSFAQGVIKEFSTAEQKHALKQLMEVPNAGKHNALYDALQQTEQFRRLMAMAHG